MSEKINASGAAFPHKNPNYDGNWDKEPQRDGMSLRDYFAAQALQCFTAGIALIENLISDEYTKKQTGQMARFAYFLADAMIKVRQSNE